MQYIVFYISSHGFGHLTRCLAIAEELLNTSNYSIYIICAEKQNNFAKKYLNKYSERVFFRDLNTDIGLINKSGSLEVDKKLLEKKLSEFTSSWDGIVRNEVDLFKNQQIKAIICDISSIGILTAQELDVTLIKISNFTWLHQYEFLNLKHEIQEVFRNSYKGIDLYIEYDLTLDHSFIETKKETTGFICRNISNKRVAEIKKEFGEILFISCGKSADLPKIKVKNFTGTIIYTQGIDIESETKKYKLPIDVLDSHNYMAAADMALVKAGWGSIAEGLIGHTPLILMERNGVLEDSFMINELKKRELAVSISPNNIKEFDYEFWKKEVSKKINIKNLSSIENSTSNLTKLIIKNI